MDNYQKSRGAVRVQVPICDKQTVTELSSDFSLPDYQPQIKRLLRVCATVSPPDRYVGSGRAEFSGNVDYSILYSGNDGALYCATERADYQWSVPVEMTADIDLNEGFVCDVDVVPDIATGRVIAPRRLSVKCRLRSHVRLWGIRQIEESISAPEQYGIERLCGHTKSARLFVGNGEPLQLGDEILLDATDADLRVISAEGEVFVQDATAGSGVVNARGEVCLKLLCCRESAPNTPVLQLRRIPFEQEIVTEGAEVNCDCCADGVCSEIRVTVEEGRLLCEVSLRLRARAQRNEEFSFTRDLYSTHAECESRSTTCTLPLAIKCINGNVSLNHTATLEEVGIRTGTNVLDLSLTPSVISLEYENGKYRLTGRCRAHVILADEEDFYAQEFEIPFRYDTDGEDNPTLDYDAAVSTVSCRARVDGERIAIDAELAVALAVRGECRVEMLTEAQFGDPIARTGAVCTICYPAKSDTLWSVAKRYHRAVNAIAESNALAGSPAADSPDSLSGVKYLLV